MPVSMNKKLVVVDSDQEMEDVADTQGNEPQNDGDEEEEEEEFEIEEILDAKPGVFPAGGTGYLVKWKGYGPEHNSWVSEEDASNAMDLIHTYWKKARKDRRGRKSEPKTKSTTAPKGRKSLAEREESSVDAESAAPSKKRGRPSKPVAQSVSDDEVDEVTQPKKTKQVAKRPAESTSARKARAKPAEEEIEEDEDEQFIDIKKLKNLDDWSPLVESIDTIERTADGTLFVYFILNAKGKTKVGDPVHRCRERSDVCRQKMPQRMLDFYEQNLRWRKLDDENGDE